MALAPTPQPYRFTVEEYLAFDAPPTSATNISTE